MNEANWKILAIVATLPCAAVTSLCLPVAANESGPEQFFAFLGLVFSIRGACDLIDYSIFGRKWS